MPPSSPTRSTVALSMISPITVLLVAGTVAIALAADLAWWVAVLLAMTVWVSKALLSSRLARFAASRSPRIDPFALREPWRLYVKDALGSQRRFDSALDSVAAGPLRDRLAEINKRVERGVIECWEVAKKGQQLADARRAIDISSARRSAAKIDSHPALLEAAASEIAAHERLRTREDEVKVSLEVLDARLQEAVARASEMATRTMATDDLDSITDAIDGVVGDLESLRLGLDSVDGTR